MTRESQFLLFFRRLWQLFEGLFPERQIFLRARGRVGFISISRRVQVVSLALVLSFGGWVIYTSIYYGSFDWILREKNKQIADAGVAYSSAMSEINRFTKERDKLRGQVDSLQSRLDELRTTEAALLDRLTRRSSKTIKDVEKLIIMTGLKPDTLIARISTPGDADGDSGQGGPFISVARGGPRDPHLDAKVAKLDSKINRWQKLQRVLRYLPLASPVDHYRLASGYGRRRDPINKRWSRHYGIDLAYHRNTPVLAPAPGTVAFSGRRGGLGRVVEIDHGMGIRTRYGHLSRILVKHGQTVGFRDKIGLLGNSGRSTGPHVHYEILVDGKPQNPMKFIKAGRYAFKG